MLRGAFRPVLRLFSQMQRRPEPLLSLRGAQRRGNPIESRNLTTAFIGFPRSPPFARNDPPKKWGSKGDGCFGFPSGSAPLPSLFGPAKSRILGRDGMSGRFPSGSALSPSLRGIADAVAIRSENRDLVTHSEANLRAAETSYTSPILKPRTFRCGV